MQCIVYLSSFIWMLEMSMATLLSGAEYDQSTKERLQAKAQNLITSDHWTQRLAAVNIAKV